MQSVVPAPARRVVAPYGVLLPISRVRISESKVLALTVYYSKVAHCARRGGYQPPVFGIRAERSEVIHP